MTTAGVIHIAVLSGSNIAIVAMLIFVLTRVLPYRLRIVTTIIVVVWFILLSGAEPPAVRAGLLVIIIFVGKWIHRAPHTGRALLCIAVVMVLYHPSALVFDMSFQLSFLATIGIVYVAPVVERYTRWITERYGLREVVAGTVGAQITVTPLLLYATGVLSIVSLPANILIGWSVPLLMLCGFVAGVLHVVSYIVAAPVIWVGELFSRYIIVITEQAAHIPYAQLVVPVHYPIVLCGMYIILFLIVKRLQNVHEKGSN
jgi:competence protein ComEC